MKKVFFLSFLAFLFVVVSCNKKNDKDTQSVSESYFMNHEMVSFGKIDVNQIQQMAELDKIPLLGALVGSQIENIKKGVDVKTPIYFGFELNNDETKMTAFAKVENKDSLKSILAGEGYSFETIDDMLLAEEDGMIIAFNESFATIQTGDKLDGKKFIQDLKQNLTKESDDKNLVQTIQKTLSFDSPISITASLEKLNSINLSDLGSTIKTTKVKDDLNKDLYQHFNILFNKGDITINTETLGDTKQLSKLNFIGKNTFANKIRLTGKESFYLALNANFAKIEQAQKSVFAEILKEINKEGLAGIGNFISKDHPLTSLASGELFVASQPNTVDFMKPFTSFLIRSNNAEMKQYITDFLFKLDENANVNVTSDAIEGSVFNQNPPTTSKKLDLSKKLFLLHLDMNYVASTLERAGSMEAAYVKPYQSLDIEIEQHTAKMTIELKDKSKNAIASLVKYYSSLFLE